MPRPPGPFNTRTSQPLAVRVPNELFDAIVKACTDGTGNTQTFKANWPAWAREALREKLGQRTKATLGSAQLEGYEAGRKQGWAHANAAFREALKVAGEKLK
jgi:hypothetical protein